MDFSMRTIGKFALIAFIVYFVVTNPVDAAGFVHGALDMAEGAAQGFGTFISSLA